MSAVHSDYVEPAVTPLSYVRRPVRAEDYDAQIVCRVSISTLWPDSHFAEESIVVTDSTRAAVLEALDDPRFAFRTPETLAAATDRPVEEVRNALRSLAREVRNPILTRPSERDLYRLRRRGLTFGERVRKFRDTLTRG